MLQTPNNGPLSQLLLRPRN